eukprot:2657919-Prymnesium_polylepis.1
MGRRFRRYYAECAAAGRSCACESSCQTCQWEGIVSAHCLQRRARMCVAGAASRIRAQSLVVEEQ